MTVIAGVSGSGKSTLIQQVLYPAARRALKLEAPEPGPHKALRLPKSIRRAVAVDQSPIGRTPRSVPATFLGVWDEVRKLFAARPDAQVRGYGPARFSFNTGLRRAVPRVRGAGGHRPRDVVLAGRDHALRGVRRRALRAGDARRALPRPVRSASSWISPRRRRCEVFAAHPKIRAPLATMCDLGVGYLHTRPGVAHALRRRGPAAQARQRS